MCVYETRMSNFLEGSPMTKVIFYVGLIGMVPPSTWTSEHVSYAQDFYAGKTIRIVVGGFRLEAAKEEWPA